MKIVKFIIIFVFIILCFYGGVSYLMDQNIFKVFSNDLTVFKESSLIVWFIVVGFKYLIFFFITLLIYKMEKFSLKTIYLFFIFYVLLLFVLFLIAKHDYNHALSLHKWTAASIGVWFSVAFWLPISILIFSIVYYFIVVSIYKSKKAK